MDTPAATDSLLFERFRFDRCGRGLARLDDGGVYQQVAIGSRALEVLAVLVNRRGELVSKTELMRAVWPGTTVDEHNLTVQISSLRRVLDEGRSGTSCIQTVAGRGYRFLGSVERIQPVTGLSRDDEAVGWPLPSDDGCTGARGFGTRRRSREHPRLAHRHGTWAGLVARSRVGTGDRIRFGVAVRGSTTVGHRCCRGRGDIGHRDAPAPRLSLVVLPFQNLSGDPTEDYLADAITDDLTTDLSQYPGSVRDRPRVRLHLQGQGHGCPADRPGTRRALRRGGQRAKDRRSSAGECPTVSAETGAHLWSDRFDEAVSQTWPPGNSSSRADAGRDSASASWISRRARPA